MHPSEEFIKQITRRHFFGQTGLGLGTAALASVMGVPHTVGALLVHDEESARSELERLYQRYGKEEVVVGQFV